MNNTTYTLKNLPPRSFRPGPVKLAPWFAFLFVLAVSGGVLAGLSGKDTDSAHFWMFVICGIAGLWLAVFTPCILMWLMLHILANGRDTAREEWILTQTRKSRRALQILHADFITAAGFSPTELVNHEASPDRYSQLQVLMDNVSQVKMQPSWMKDINLPLSRIDYAAGRLQEQENVLPEAFIYQSLKKIISSLAETVLLFHESQPIAVLFEYNTSVPAHVLKNIWQQVREESGIRQPMEYAEGSGLAYADTWLNERIQDDVLLLVVAVQIAPENPEGTGEAVVGLLLGNRLTQKTVEPLALLHRPDSSPEEELEKGLMQAAYHVPLNETKLQHLWLCGLNPAQREAVTVQRQSALLASVASDSIHDIDNLLGRTGCVAPWLAVAVAAQAAQKRQTPQMIISSDSGHRAIWSAIVSSVTPPPPGADG